MIKLSDKKIKIFADGADLNSIKELNDNSLICGFTTNPSLMKKTGVKDYKSFCQDVLKITNEKPVSFEIFTDELGEMYNQANEIASWGKNVFVKIPISNSKGEKTSGLIKKLNIGISKAIPNSSRNVPITIKKNKVIDWIKPVNFKNL